MSKSKHRPLLDLEELCASDNVDVWTVTIPKSVNPADLHDKTFNFTCNVGSPITSKGVDFKIKSKKKKFSLVGISVNSQGDSKMGKDNK